MRRNRPGEVRGVGGVGALVSGDLGGGCRSDRLNGQLKPVGDQDALDHRLIEVLQDDFHQPVTDLGLGGITQPNRIDLAEQLLAILENLPSLLQQLLAAPLTTARIDHGVEPKQVDLIEVADRLEPKLTNFDHVAHWIAQSGDPTANVADDDGVHRHHQQNQPGGPVST